MTDRLEPKAIFSCNLLGGESYALVNNVDEYYKRLESLLDDIKRGKGETCDYLYFAFVSLASATLEYSLNLVLSIHCFEKYNYPMYERHIKSFLDINFTTKIEITPEIVSEGELTIKKDVPTLQNLKELADKRNKLLHNSKAVKIQTFDFPDTGAEIKDGCVFVPLDALKDDGLLEFKFELEENVITTLTSKWCVRIGNAIQKYRDNIVTPFIVHSALKENELLESCK